MSFHLILTLLASGLCSWALAQLALELLERRAASKRLRGRGEATAESASLIESLLKPIFSMYAPLFKRVRCGEARTRLERRLSQAGISDFTPEQFWAFQIFAALLFAGFWQLLRFELTLIDIHYENTWWATLMAVGVGTYFPWMWVNSTLKKRQAEIVLDFPAFVDKLTLSVEAGLDFMAAMIKVAKQSPISSLRTEVEKTASEIQIGKTRAQALRRMAERIGLRDISIFTSTLIQADRFGTSIGKVLRVQSDRLRRERFESAERKGAIAAQKLLFPLVFFIMPAVFIVVFGPLIVKLVTGGLEGLTL